MGPELGYNALGGVSSTLWLLLWLYTLGFTGAMSFTMGILARSSESCLFSYVIISVLSFTIIIPSTTLAYLLCTTRVSLQIPPKPTQYPLRRQRKPGFRIGKGLCASEKIFHRLHHTQYKVNKHLSQHVLSSTPTVLHPHHQFYILQCLDQLLAVSKSHLLSNSMDPRCLVLVNL